MKESIIFGAVILMITNFFVKILSLVYRGVLIRLIGGEGLGLWEMISPIFSLILVVASWGIPLAISNLVSRDIERKYTMFIVKTGMILLVITGFAVSFIVIAVFPFVREFIFSDRRIDFGFLATIPTVLIISFFSVYRGYFQGSHMTSLLGKSQAVEQIVRVVAGIGIIIFLIDRGYTITILLVGLSAATFLAEWSGGLYLWKKFRKEKKSAKTKGIFQQNIASRMVRMGTPITMSRLAVSFAMSCQAVLIPRALMAGGCTASTAATLFGYFSGVAMTILHLPAIITNALTTPLIPAIAEAAAENAQEKMKSRIEDSLLFTAYTAIPLLALIFYFAEPLCRILFAAEEAAPMLTLLAMGGIFFYLQQPLIAVMQGLNYFKSILAILCIGDGLYILLLALGCYHGNFTMEQGIIYFILSDIILWATAMIYLKRKIRIRFRLFKTMILPLFVSLFGLFVLEALSQRLPSSIPELLAVTMLGIAFCAVYLLLLYWMGGIDKELIARLSSRGKRYRSRT